MRKDVGILGVSAVLAAVISGCASVDWVNVGYASPASEINLKANSSVRIIALGNRAMTVPITAAVAAEFARSGQFRTDAETPDYWIVLNGDRRFRADDADARLFNRKVEKLTHRDADGGHEYIRTTNHNSSSAAAVLSVAVYEVKKLSPVCRFDIVVYDSDFKGGNVRNAGEYNRAFSRQIVLKIKDMFLTRKRRVETALPMNADRVMRKALETGDMPSLRQRADQVVPQSFDEFMKDIASGRYKGKTEELEQKLSNYYVLAVAEEVDNSAPAALKRLHARHMAILNQTSADGLVTACPNSLARIENKLKLMQAPR